jgi:hypothetical protein
VSAALRCARAWRLLVLWAIGGALPSVLATIPVWRVLASALDHSPRAADFARRFDLLAAEDLVAVFDGSGPAIAGSALAAAVVSLFIGPFLAAATIAHARSDRALGFGALAKEAIDGYARMFRMLLVSVLPLGLAATLGAFAWKAANRYAMTATLESRATWASRAALAATLIGFVALHATVEAARAELGANQDLRSAWKAWLRGVRAALRRPLAVYGAYLGAALASLALASAILLARLRVTPSNIPGLVLGALLTELAIAAIAWGKVVRLSALVALAQELAARKPTAPPRPAEERERDAADERPIPAIGRTH